MFSLSEYRIYIISSNYILIDPFRLKQIQKVYRKKKLAILHIYFFLLLVRRSSEILGFGTASLCILVWGHPWSQYIVVTR